MRDYLRPDEVDAMVQAFQAACTICDSAGPEEATEG